MKNPAFFVAFAIAAPSLAMQGSTEMFKSSLGFSVEYPVRWTKIDQSTDELAITSSRDRVKGAIIPHGQAEIIVRKAALGGKSLRDFLRESYNLDIKSRHVIKLQVSRVYPCGSLEKITADFEIAPSAIQTDVVYSCRVGNVSYMTILTYWKSERGSAWEREAFKVMITLQVPSARYKLNAQTSRL